MQFAVLRAAAGGDIDRTMTELADWLIAEGHMPVGVVRDAAPGTGRHPCEMRLRVLPDGPRIAIDQPLGPGSTGCRLDAGALEQAVVEVERRLPGRADIFLLNKFARQEAEGHGFRAAIGHALDRGLPVLLGVGRFSDGAFDAFAGGLAKTLPCDRAMLRDWCRSALKVNTP